ncbi:chemotaxis protein CheW [Amphritea japonica]|nr:chemotaxis protein CheW [Amphritea japonica]
MELLNNEPQVEAFSDIAPSTGAYDLRHGFRVGFLQLLLQSQTRSELLRCEQVCGIPDTPGWFVGFMNHRGEAVPVYDFAASLGLEATNQKEGWLLLLGEHPEAAALLLADTPESVTSPQVLPQDVSLPIPDILKNICGGQYQHQNSVWFELNHQAYFIAQKQRFRRAESNLNIDQGI